MRTFQVKGFLLKTGDEVTRRFHAKTAEEAEAQAQGEKIRPFEVEEVLGGSESLGATASRMVIPHAVLRSVHIALAVQIKSGSTPLNAVNSIMQSMRHRGAKAVLRLLRDRLLEADSLSKAMGFFPRIWPKNVRAVLDAVEQRSPDSFAKQLNEIVRTADEMNDLKKMVQGQTLMPAASLVVGTIVMGIMMVFTLPRFAEFMKDMGIRDVPALTIWAVEAGKWIKAGGWTWLLVALGVLIAGVVIAAFTGHLARWAMWVARRTPVMKEILRLQDYTTMMAVYGSVYMATTNTSEALQFSVEVISDPDLADKGRRAIEASKRGEDFVAAMRRIGGFDDSWLNCMVAPEARLNSVEICGQFRDVYVRETSHLATRFGVFVNWLALGMTLSVVLLILYVFGKPFLTMIQEMAAKI